MAEKCIQIVCVYEWHGTLQVVTKLKWYSSLLNLVLLVYLVSWAYWTNLGCEIAGSISWLSWVSLLFMFVHIGHVWAASIMYRILEDLLFERLSLHILYFLQKVFSRYFKLSTKTCPLPSATLCFSACYGILLQKFRISHDFSSKEMQGHSWDRLINF